MPARIIFRSVVSPDEAGPSVQIILVLTRIIPHYHDKQKPSRDKKLRDGGPIILH